VAQLVAHLHGMEGVRGSNPLSSTNVLSRDIRDASNPKVRGVSGFWGWAGVLGLCRDCQAAAGVSRSTSSISYFGFGVINNT
jgi:hypothetical protein